MIKLVYIFNGRLPTEKAHGLQITKMCEAFAQCDVNIRMPACPPYLCTKEGAANDMNRINVELVVPYRSNPIKENIFEFYGAKNSFAVKKIWALDPMSIKWFPERLAFWVQSLTSGISIILYLLTYWHSRGTIFYARDYVSLLILSFLGLRPIAEIHDYRFSRPRSLVNSIIKRVDKIVVNSEGTLKLLEAHYEIHGNKSVIAPNGVDLDFFNISETREEARRSLDMPLDKKIVGYVGRLETVGKEKGVPTLISAMAKLNYRNDTVLYVVGGPDELVLKYRNQYSSVSDLVLTGQVAYKKIPLYLRAMDAVVIPIPDDRHAKTTSPIKLFEFLAAKKAIIASDLPAVRNYLNDGNALFFKAGDAEDLAVKISRILNERGLKERLSANAKIDSKQFSWLNRANKILNDV